MKKIKIGVVMDPISNINIDKDSTFDILLEAQKRKYIIYYMEINDLYIKNNFAYGRTRKLILTKKTTKWFTFTHEENILLHTLDIILMRKDPPFNMEFIYATYILEYAEKQGVLIINKPKSLRNYNEKIFILSFPKVIPETIVTRKIKHIHEFWNTYKDIIIKPLNNMGGKSIFRINKYGNNLSVISEIMTNYENSFCMLQRYLPSITKGDKRILLINGKIVPWCLARIPKPGDIRGNLAAGGKGVVQKINEQDMEIINTIVPKLQKKGLILVGIDMIGNKITEINITSPTGICEIQKKSNFLISSLLLDEIEKICI